MSTGHDLVALGDTKIGYRYSTGPTRTTGQDGYFDCSGYIYYLVHALGGPGDFPASSSTQAMFCRDHGTLISEAEARRTPGALAFRGYNHGYQGFGPNGHVVMSRGDGTTDEAMGRRWGVTHGHFDGRGFSNWARVPGFNYSGAPTPVPPAPPPVQQEDPDKMEVIQVNPVDQANRTKRAYAFFDPKEGHLIGYHGIKVKWNDRSAADAPWIGAHEPYFIDIPGDGWTGAKTVKETDGETIFIAFGLGGAEIVGYARE